jgi:hypothetical protein
MLRPSQRTHGRVTLTLSVTPASCLILTLTITNTLILVSACAEVRWVVDGFNLNRKNNFRPGWGESKPAPTSTSNPYPQCNPSPNPHPNPIPTPIPRSQRSIGSRREYDSLEREYRCNRVGSASLVCQTKAETTRG